MIPSDQAAGDYETRFDAIWNSIAEFQLPSLGQSYCCPLAADFATWCKSHCAKNVTKKTPGPLYKAQWQLQEKYVECWVLLPHSCRHRTTPDGPPCLHQVWLEAYFRLKAALLPMTPPLFQPRGLPPTGYPDLDLGEEPAG